VALATENNKTGGTKVRLYFIPLRAYSLPPKRVLRNFSDREQIETKKDRFKKRRQLIISAVIPNADLNSRMSATKDRLCAI
jgi:hypothetical protein